MHPFRKLLHVSLGKATTLESALSPVMWSRLYKMARQQTLVGVLNDGLHRLPENQLPPEGLFTEWDKTTEKIERIYHLHERHITELEELLQRLGLHGCILKGTGLAHLYPNPGRRTCGDIDVWIKGRRDAILEVFDEAEFPIYDIIYQECKVGIFLDTEVEVHFHPCKMYNPFLNARLQRFFERNSPIRDDVALTFPDARFNAVYCMSHMFRHYLEGGIGLRQFLDYYYILKELSPEDRKSVMRTLRRLGMGRFTASVMKLLQFNFLLEDEYLLCPPDSKYGKKLVQDVISMGNFGVMDKRNYANQGESKWARFRRKNRRVFSNFWSYPREVFWSPFARVSQHVWRRFKGYL